MNEVGVENTFFDLGGDSLSAVEVLTRLDAELKLKFEPGQLVSQTLGQLAAVCEERLSRRRLGSEAHTPVRNPRHAAGDESCFYFGPGDGELFGCYHSPPAAAYRESAVVLCPATGHEQIQFHRPYRQLALRLCGLGFGILRFDFFGCGDSAGASEEGETSRWLGDVSTAVGEIERVGSAATVCLVGLRLGGSLAMMAGAARGDIDSMVLWDPVISGQTYLEELEKLHATMLRSAHVLPRAPQGQKRAGTEILGFPAPETQLSGLKGIDLFAVSPAPAQRVLIVDSQVDPSARKLGDHLSEQGASARYEHLPDRQLWQWEEDVERIQAPHRSLQWIDEAYR